MALRVLLADNSDTIKKVIQLALQDYAAEVKTVTTGTDVMNVARTFRPDIIFADVLLQQRNGYEVSQDLKSQTDFAAIPIVLLWSGFMELDEQKFKAAKANDRLEKPFDPEVLRALVQKLVPKTQGHDLGQHLVFPTPPPLPKETSPKIEAPQNPSARNWSMDSFEDIHKFESPSELPDLELAGVPSEGPPEGVDQFSMHSFSPKRELPPLNPIGAATNIDYDDNMTAMEVETPESLRLKKNFNPTANLKSGVDLGSLDQGSEEEVNDKDWVRKDISEFEVQLPAASEEISFDFLTPEESIKPTEFLFNPRKKGAIGPVDPDSETIGTYQSPPTEIPLFDQKTRVSSQPSLQDPQAQPIPALSEAQIEAILRSQSREIIERLAMKIVPDIASELIKKEIKRLLDEAPNL